MNGSLLSRARNRLGKMIRREPDDPVAAGAAAFWDRGPDCNSMHWTEHPLVAEYVNSCVTGVAWLNGLKGLKAGWAYRPLARALSVGCGTGALERELYYLRVAEKIEGVDISRASLAHARRLNREAGVRGVRYRVADFNRLSLPESHYDIVFFHGSLHHANDPDSLLAAVSQALKPDGLLYVDEYVGPSRDEWGDGHLTEAREEFERLAEEWKLWPVNPPLDTSDPSEMIRSSAIRGAIERQFEVLHYSPYWGNFLFPLISALKRRPVLAEENRPVVARWIEREKELVADGTYRDPLYAVYLGRKRH